MKEDWQFPEIARWSNTLDYLVETQKSNNCMCLAFERMKLLASYLAYNQDETV